MKVGDSVIHKDYPNVKGQVVAKTQKWPGSVPIFLVIWADDRRTSRHIEHALRATVR